MRSTVSKIVGRVSGKGRGSVWSPTDFLDLGTRDAVDQSLSRLVRRGFLRGSARGERARPLDAGTRAGGVPDGRPVAHREGGPPGDPAQARHLHADGGGGNEGGNGHPGAALPG